METTKTQMTQEEYEAAYDRFNTRIQDAFHLEMAEQAMREAVKEWSLVKKAWGEQNG